MKNKFYDYLQVFNELKNLNTEKESLITFFKKATKASDHSTCGRKHVGAVIFYWSEKSNKYNLKKGDLIGQGWNGYKELADETRYGIGVSDSKINCKQQYAKLAEIGIHPDSDEGRAIHLIIMKDEIHAEDRAIQSAIRNYDEKILKESIIFTTLSPCKDCAEMIKKYDLAVGGWLEKYNRDGGKGISKINKILLDNKILEF